jgi:hypothetical protein
MASQTPTENELERMSTAALRSIVREDDRRRRSGVPTPEDETARAERARNIITARLAK